MSSLIFSNREPQIGHFSNGTNLDNFPDLFSKTGPIILGIISPALKTLTQSLTRMSFATIYCALCNVAAETIEPSNSIGCNFATYVTLPVRPTVAIICFNFVTTTVGANLYAIAHLGNLLVSPISLYNES